MPLLVLGAFAVLQGSMVGVTSTFEKLGIGRIVT
jgi:hypothetical protein